MKSMIGKKKDRGRKVQVQVPSRPPARPPDLYAKLERVLKVVIGIKSHFAPPTITPNLELHAWHSRHTLSRMERPAKRAKMDFTKEATVEVIYNSKTTTFHVPTQLAMSQSADMDSYFKTYCDGTYRIYTHEPTIFCMLLELWHYDEIVLDRDLDTTEQWMHLFKVYSLALDVDASPSSDKILAVIKQRLDRGEIPPAAAVAWTYETPDEDCGAVREAVVEAVCKKLLQKDLSNPLTDFVNDVMKEAKKRKDP
ncbi:Hypothetical predicted protein [Lecanosticta acicola]|uniref:Uncharacterized protein n=1 Tax=Lecanosticta acicola TaxID=111012 RepID=A0AAI8YSB2_9PEZI|nr:Hypothetical predicted protein [Lecanosticta acicola]